MHIKIKHLFIILIFTLYTNPTFSKIYIEKIGPDFSHPWGVSVLNKNELLITERKGILSKLNIKTGEKIIILNTPKVFNVGQGGLLDVHTLKQNNITNVYFCYSKYDPPVKSYTILQKSILKENSLSQNQIIFSTNMPSGSPIHYGCRIAILDQYIYLSLGDRGRRDNAQKPEFHDGSVIRLNLNGKRIDKNPFYQTPLTEVFTIGHRNPQGLAINPNDEKIWSHEHGPQGGDEINIIEAGGNYGWPIVSHGEEYGGGKIGIGTSAPGLIDPVWKWIPSIAPSGMAFYNKDMFPEFKNHLLVGSLKFKQLYLIYLEDNIPIKEKTVLNQSIGRIRDIEVLNDGSIIILTDEENGGVFRLYNK